MLQKFIASGATKATIAGMLKALYTFSDNQIFSILEDYLPKHRARSTASFDDLFNAYCVEAIRDPASIDAYINEHGSGNVQKYSTQLHRRAEFFNAIHRKYQQ